MGSWEWPAVGREVGWAWPCWAGSHGVWAIALLGCFRRSSCISASARPMQSWSATLSSPWLLERSQPAHFLMKRHTSACPRSLAAKDRIGSPLSWTIRERATLATFGFSSRTARALMAASRSASGSSSTGKGPIVLRVTSLRNFASRHSNSCMLVSVPVR